MNNLIYKMSSSKSYSCGICNTSADQISHHKAHLNTEKHKYKKELFEFKLSKLSIENLQEKRKTNVYLLFFLRFLGAPIP